ncbi:putative alpha-glucoside transport protein [Dipodascopsis uninucleata]
MTDIQLEPTKLDLLHVEDDTTLDKETSKYTGHKMLEEAKKAAEREHALGIVDALKAYPYAVLWSFIVSMTIIMEGYDTNLIGNFFAYPQFKEYYGNYYPGLGREVSGPWQVALTDAQSIGTFFGVLINGYASKQFGHKKVLLVSLVLMIAFVFLTVFAPSVEVLFVGQLLCGFPWGVFATIGPAYASEVCPLALRGYLTSYINLCFATGQLISAGVLYGCKDIDNEWSFRIPFAVQWAWPAPLIVILYFAPDSPWWLVRKNRLADAEKAMRRLCAKNSPTSPEQMIALIVHTNNLELQLETGDSYFDCFKGTDLRRTEISCVSFAGQVLAGSQFAYSPTYFFEQAGMDTSQAYKMNIGGTALAFFGTCLSWIFMTFLGRRTIYISGMAAMSTLLIVVGFLSLAPESNSSALWGQAALTVLWLFSFSMSVGPVGWAIPSETSSTRLRQKTVCLARNAYYISSIIAGVLSPYMINPTEWNWKGKTGFFWGGSAFLTTVWAYFRLPETKGRTFAELDVLFEKRVPARKFRSYAVNAYLDEIDEIIKQDDTENTPV